MDWSHWTIPTFKFTGKSEPFFLWGIEIYLLCFSMCPNYTCLEGFSFNAKSWKEGRQLHTDRNLEEKMGLKAHGLCRMHSIVYLGLEPTRKAIWRHAEERSQEGTGNIQFIHVRTVSCLSWLTKRTLNTGSVHGTAQDSERTRATVETCLPSTDENLMIISHHSLLCTVK